MKAAQTRMDLRIVDFDEQYALGVRSGADRVTVVFVDFERCILVLLVVSVQRGAALLLNDCLLLA
ncbi:hypothetical protein D3C84_976320 [compost metagenome]